LGAQSFQPKYLELLGRDHTRGQIRGAVEAAEKAGVAEISVDIIFGIPGQTVSEVLSDLQEAAMLPIHHISTYSLTIEKGTPFFQRQERGLLALPPDDVVVEMLRKIPSFLSQHRFERYEISNYARDSRVSRHNLSYWNGHDYLGIGAGAHSFVINPEAGQRSEGLRWSNCALPADYMKRIDEGSAISWQDRLSARSLEFEFFFLGLRKSAGVDLSTFDILFGSVALDRYQKVIGELVAEGYVERAGSVIRLTANGIALSDSVVERFLV
jgi:oxygen-independent coproporphyrinogen-3 oxidase